MTSSCLFKAIAGETASRERGRYRVNSRLTRLLTGKVATGALDQFLWRSKNLSRILESYLSTPMTALIFGRSKVGAFRRIAMCSQFRPPPEGRECSDSDNKAMAKAGGGRSILLSVLSET